MNKYGVPMMMTESAMQMMFDSDFTDIETSEYISKISSDTYKLIINGPLIKKGNWLDSLFGISAYSSINKALKELLNNEECQNIILDIDSPGGMVNGCGELAELIYRARESKNIVSYISGLGCSAAYYLASAASKVYAHKSASAGSIGVIACYQINKDENTKTIEIVSSNSKDKRLNPETEEGKNKIQSEVDELANIFAQDVARFRNIDVAAVENTNGGTFIGQKALEMKLVDEISDLETIVKDFIMNPTENTAVVDKTTVSEAKLSEADIIAQTTARVSAILNQGNKLGLGMLAEQLVASNLDKEQALKMLESASLDKQANVKDEETKEATTVVEATDFSKVMSQTKNPVIQAKDADDDEESSTVSAMLAIANKM